MASMWRKAMLYLGLGPDEEYDDYNVSAERPAAARPAPPAPRPAAPSVQHGQEPSGSVRTLTPSPAEAGADQVNGNGTHTGRTGPPAGPVPPSGDRADPPDRADRADRAARGRSSIVRPLSGSPTSKLHVVGPSSFNDAQEVADKYKENVPVILNLQGVDRDLSRRIIDFASGLCYGLGGQMERVANQVYLLTPSDVEVSAEDRQRLHERGYEA
jgi:cell division inhibitor SepF